MMTSESGCQLYVVRKEQNVKKVFSMLFAVVMLLSLCPLTFAAEDEVNTGFNEKTILQAIEEYFVDRNLILDGAQNIDDYPGLFTLDDEIYIG